MNVYSPLSLGNPLTVLKVTLLTRKESSSHLYNKCLYMFVWTHSVASMWAWASKANHWCGSETVDEGEFPYFWERCQWGKQGAKITKEMCPMAQVRISMSHAPFLTSVVSQIRQSHGERQLFIYAFKRTWDGLPVFSCLVNASNYRCRQTCVTKGKSGNMTAGNILSNFQRNQRIKCATEVIHICTLLVVKNLDSIDAII